MPKNKYLYLPFPSEYQSRNLSSFFVSDFFQLPCCGGKSAHRHTFYEIHWLLSGSATLISDFNRYSVQGGTLVFIAPGQIHTWDNVSNHDTNLIVVGFDIQLLTLHPNSSSILNQLPYFNPTLPPYITMDNARKDLFNYLFRTILQRYKEMSNDHISLLSSYLNVILSEVNYFCDQNPQLQGTSSNLTTGFMLAINTHFASRKRIQDYADLLGVTTNHLIETVRSKTGKTPGQWQQERLLLEAKRFLVYTNDTVGEISNQLSFNNPSQFGKWFKKLTDESPGTFRQSMKI